MKNYSHLTVFHRQIIGKLKKQGRSLRYIARILGVAPSTISREIKRNYTGFGYCCYLADDKSRSRRWRANQMHLKLDREAVRLVEKLIRQKHSPEQITSQFPSMLNRSISTQSIYRFLRSYRGSHLRKLLRRKGKRYIPKSQLRATVRNRPCIDDRPPEVAMRSSFGHWEADLMEGPIHTKGSLLLLVERKSRFVLTRFVKNRTSSLVANAIISMLKPYRALTITFDNGTEFAAYKRVSKSTGAASYFCHPYHAWEKGLVENTIGLLREYYPKKTTIPACHRIHNVIRRQINQRPRKTLGFISPQSLVDNIQKTS